MLNWLDSFFGNAAATIGQAVASAVHWAIRGVMGVILSVFSLVGRGWDNLVYYGHQFYAFLRGFYDAVIRFAQYVVHIAIPAVYRWASNELDGLWNYATGVYHYAIEVWNDLLQRITLAYHDIESWVIGNIWAPLKAWIDDIYQKLGQWAYVAWWWITHPADLADALFWPLVDALEANAWQIAGRLGQFTLALIVRNLAQVLDLIETIIAGVL